MSRRSHEKIGDCEQSISTVDYRFSEIQESLSFLVVCLFVLISDVLQQLLIMSWKILLIMDNVYKGFR